jgi:hypothetical protein
MCTIAGESGEANLTATWSFPDLLELVTKGRNIRIKHLRANVEYRMSS